MSSRGLEAMAEDLSSDAIFLNKLMPKPTAEAAQPLSMQAAGGGNLHIPGKCEGNEQDDDDQGAIKSDAAVETSTGDTYPIAYICEDGSTCRMKKTSEETKTEPFRAKKTTSKNNNDMNVAYNDSFKETDSNMHTKARDQNPMYTQGTMNPPNDITFNSMYTQCTMDVIPNPMYTQSSMNPPPNQVSRNPMHSRSIMTPLPNEDNSNQMYTQSKINPSPNDVTLNPVYTQSTTNPSPNDDTPNPMYTQSTMNPPPYDDTPNSMYTQSTMNPLPNDDTPNPVYLQSIMAMEPDVSPGQASKSNNSDGNFCTQPSADTRQQGDEVTFIPATNDGKQLKNGDEESVVEAANNEDIKPYAAKYQEDDEPATESIGCDAIQPYAVKYKERDTTAENGQTDSITSDDIDINPYASAYMNQDVIAGGTTSGDNQPTAAPNSNNDVLGNPSSNDATNPTDVVSEERQHVPHALHPNPFYVPNAQHSADWECTRQQVCSVPTAVTVVGLFIVSVVFFWLFFDTNTPAPTVTVDTTFISGPTGVPTPPAVFNSSQHEENHQGPTGCCRFNSSTTAVSNGAQPAAICRSLVEAKTFLRT
ncbi:uncharacterized protein LOC118432838 [Branchiostoma floridae]|uniref:Uncharacterized protein LOC118432838 n=1 Tax=Branchiostoma floridae TaxID=7739 RepID=A0A9J7MHM6_BRAFL|nr:uncharacterized protein LOC118432838 [Branchiostoma floridae]